MNSLKVISLLIIIYIFFLVPVIYSNTHHESFSEREDREWEENFEDKFQSDPIEGFSRDPSRAWNTLNSDPQSIRNNPEMVTAAFENSIDDFVNLVHENLDLLSDPHVREAYEKAIGQNPSLANEHPEAFREFLTQKGIVPPGNNNFEVINFNNLNGEMQIRTQDGRLVEFNIGDTSRILDDGSIILDNGIQVSSGRVSSYFQGSDKMYSLTQTQEGVEVEAIIRNEIFRGNDMTLGGNIETGQFVEVLNSPIRTLNGDRVLSSGRYTLFENGNYALSGDIRYFDENGDSIQAYSTQQDTTITTQEIGCGESGNCIVESVNEFGEPTIEITTSNNHDIRIEINNLDERTVEVNEILDSSSVQIESITENERVEFVVTREETTQSGFMSEDNKLTVISSHPNPINPSQGSIQHINGFSSLNPNGQNAQVTQISDFVNSFESFNPQEIDIAEFLEDIGVEPTNANILELHNQFQREGLIPDSTIQETTLQRANQEVLEAIRERENDPTITLNDLGIESTNANILDLHRQLQSEGFIQGSTIEQTTIEGASREVLEAIQRISENENIDIEIRSSRISNEDLDSQDIGVIRPEISISTPNQLPNIEGQWSAQSCQSSSSRNCGIGAYNFRVQEISSGERLYVAANGDMFNDRGVRVNQNGQYINLNGNTCDSPCSYNSQVNFFRGGLRQDEARGLISYS